MPSSQLLPIYYCFLYLFLRLKLYLQQYFSCIYKSITKPLLRSLFLLSFNVNKSCIEAIGEGDGEISRLGVIEDEVSKGAIVLLYTAGFLESTYH